MNEKILKAAEKYKTKLPKTKIIKKGLVKHKYFIDDAEEVMYECEFADDVPEYALDYEIEPPEPDQILCKAKKLAQDILQFISDNGLDDAKLVIQNDDYHGYFQDAYLEGEVPRTTEDIKRDVEQFILKEMDKERAKSNKIKSKEEKKKEKELALLKELKKKYE